MFEVQSDKAGGWWPYSAYKGERLGDTWTWIEGSRWIYVFRKPRGATNAPAPLVDELYLDEKGHLHATKLNAAVTVKKDPRPERGKSGVASQREPMVDIGTTVSFVRQLLGEPLVHYFFASRVQLPNTAIAELQKHIAAWAPGITFEPADPNFVWAGGRDNLAVPVLDPITIATHLHAYYVAASDDLIKYLTPVDDEDDPHSEQRKKKAKERQKKFLLAQIVSSLLDADGTLVGKADQTRLYNFQRGHAEQIKYRRQWRERWAMYLSNWLKARPILLLAEAHQFDEKGEFPDFLLHMAHCHSRLCESDAGRELLKAHFEQPTEFPWVQKYVLGRSKGIEAIESKDFQQMGRRLGSAPLELLKEHAPVWMAEAKKTVAEEISEALVKMFGVDAKPERMTNWAGKELYVAWGKAGWEDFQWGEVDLIKIAEHPGERELKPMWKGAVGSILEGIELLNFALALHSFGKKMKGEELNEKIWAFVELTEAGAHLSAATVSLFGKASKKTIAKLTFVAGAIDAVLGAKETAEALSEAKFGKALGSGIVTVGGLVVALGFFAESSVAGPVGFLIMGAGYLIKWIFRDDTDLEKFIDFSSFGNHGGDKEEKPGWYETELRFSEWNDDHLDEQLRAAVFLLCKFAIEPEHIRGSENSQVGQYNIDSYVNSLKDSLRRGKIKMGWVPRGAKLHLQYSEEWVDAHDSRKLMAEIDFGDGEKPKVASSKLGVEPEQGGRTVVVQGPESASTEKPILDLEEHGGFYGGGVEFKGVNKSLKKIALTGSLEISLGGNTFFVHAEKKESVLYAPYP
jgi:hypothetical protein